MELELGWWWAVIVPGVWLVAGVVLAVSFGFFSHAGRGGE